MACIVHTREQHVLGVFVFILRADDEVGVLLILGGFLLALPHGLALRHDGLAVVAVLLKSHLRGESLSVEQWAIAILVAAQIVAEGEDILGRVLVHRRIGRRADHDQGVARVADHQHEHAEQHRVLRTSRDERQLVFLQVQHEPDDSQCDDADDEGRPAPAVEGDAEHAEGQQECQILDGVAVSLRLSLIDSPDDAADEQDDIDDLTRVEGHAQGVDEEQLEPSADGDDARHDAIEDGHEDGHREAEGNQGALQVGIGEAAVVVNQTDGWQTEQVQQVDTDGKSRHIHDKHEPAVAVRLVGVVFPLQDEPEHQSREGRGVGIDLTLDGREPEGVAKGVDEGAHQSGGLDGYHLGARQLVPVADQQPSRQMRDAPEKEEDTGR